jgi:hypothetical protein
MPERRTYGGREDEVNIVSADDEGEEFESDDDEGIELEELFEPGEKCHICSAEDGRIGLDPSCHGSYDGEPALLGRNCAEAALKDAYAQNDGIAIVVEPFGDNNFHLYYRLDEMPAYGFSREDIEGISWLLLTIGDACARCGEQSHTAWLTTKFVDPSLPEEPDRNVFRNLDKDIEHLCRACTAAALAAAYGKLNLPMLTIEVPRSAMGIMMPSGAE